MPNEVNRRSRSHVELSRAEARSLLLRELGFHRSRRPTARNVRQLLVERRCIQLDPLDPMGTNADLVAMARLPGLPRGRLYKWIYQGAFEHFAKERCLLPATAFPYYRHAMAQTPWWRLGERLRRLPKQLVDDVEAEVHERGPISAAELTERGRVQPLDWSGWKSTSKAASMALEVLWTQCRIVVCGRGSHGKLYAPPTVLGDQVDVSAPRCEFEQWALTERVAAAGLLARASGPTWSMLRDVRESALVDELVEEGRLTEVAVEGSRRPYLALPTALQGRTCRGTDELRIIAPLDALLWDRKLVRQAFGFEYIWEVYKPAAKRRWAWYVMPLLQNDRLVGRVAGKVSGSTLIIEHIWREAQPLDEKRLDDALQSHAEACGCSSFVRPKRIRRNPAR